MGQTIRRGHPVYTADARLSNTLDMQEFRRATPRELSQWGRMNISLVDQAHIRWELGRTVVGTSYIIKIHSDFVGYAHIHDVWRLVTWYDPTHQQIIPPDEVMVYFITVIDPRLPRRMVEDAVDSFSRQLGAPTYFHDKRQ